MCDSSCDFFSILQKRKVKLREGPWDGQDYSANHCVARTRLRPILHQRLYSLWYRASPCTGRSVAEGLRAFDSTAVFISPFSIFLLPSFSLFCLIYFPGEVEWGACLSSLLMVTATLSHCFWRCHGSPQEHSDRKVAESPWAEGALTNPQAIFQWLPVCGVFWLMAWFQVAHTAVECWGRMRNGSYVYEKHMYIKIGNVYAHGRHADAKHIFMKSIDRSRGDCTCMPPSPRPASALASAKLRGHSAAALPQAFQSELGRWGLEAGPGLQGAHNPKGFFFFREDNRDSSIYRSIVMS